MNIASKMTQALGINPLTMRPPSKIVTLNMARNGSGDTPQDVRKKIEYRSGRMSPLVGMAVHPEHRSAVEHMFNYCWWQAETCQKRGAAPGDLYLWCDLANHIGTILGASAHVYNDNMTRHASR